VHDKKVAEGMKIAAAPALTDRSLDPNNGARKAKEVNEGKKKIADEVMETN
jgi:hypothetical protein